MLTLLIAVQHAVKRNELGVATSLNQFSRSIGGAVGVAIMGAVLSAGLTAQLNQAARSESAVITPTQAEEFAANPNALIEPEARVNISPAALDVLQSAMASAIHRVFWVGTVLSALALLVSLFLPRAGKENDSEVNSIPKMDSIEVT
jgi:hypothetical protein